MKKLKKILLLVSLIFSYVTFAQSWDIGGNNIAGRSGSQLIGITSPNTKNIVFVNGSTLGIPIERGRITSDGLWAIGTFNPNSRVHINGATGQTPFRIQISGTTKLYVNSNGGIYAGGSGVPPANGLHVLGNLHSGSGSFANDAKLHIPEVVSTSLTNGGIYVAGAENSTNIAIAQKSLRARSNGSDAMLFLNASGGDINMNNGAVVVRSTEKKVGLMTSVPQTELHLVHQSNGPESAGIRLETAGPDIQTWTFYTQNTDGKLSLYEATGVFGEYVGSLKGLFDDASGAYSSLSDERYKKDIEDAGSILKDVLELDIKKYHFVNNEAHDKKYYGLLAQEVEKLFPELVKLGKRDDGREIYTMDYNAFGVLALKAIQERQKLLDAQKEEIDNLRQAVNELMKEHTGGTAKTGNWSSL